MNKILLLTYCFFITTSVVQAADTGETCANGAGTVIIGTVTGHQYCKSNNNMNWWNAVSWCDGTSKQLFSMNDCGCDGSVNCSNACPELKNISDSIWEWSWTSTPVSDTVYGINLQHGGLHNSDPRNLEHRRAICK